MTEYTYKSILTKAKTIKNNVETNYEIGVSASWSYYIAKAILKPNKNVEKITIKKAEKSTGNNFSRQIYQDAYKDMAERLVKYVNKHKQMPNNIKVYNKLMRVSDYTYMFARILVYYNKKGKLPNHAEVNSKAFTKPTEYPNKVYGLWVKYIKTKPKCLDDVCDYVKAHFDYLFYNDDVRSNEQVIKDKAGNCTDLLQMLINMAEAMDYDWEVYHVKCNVSGVGHVYGRFKKKGTNNWFVRDIACIADESRYCIWCEAGNGGNLLAKNPYWFLQNLNR